MIIIFTDLDGTLLDLKNYSFEKAKESLNLIHRLKIPLIICSSKTKCEIEYFRRKLKNNHPFVSENGGGIYIPKNYLKKEIKKYKIEKSQEYFLIKLGEKYDNLRKVLNKIKNMGFKIKGFGDMSIKEIMKLTNLNKYLSKLAKTREFDEVFISEENKENEKRILSFIKKSKLKYTKGELFHILGKNNKGKAVKILKDLYKKEFGNIFSIGIGDGENDIPMLKNVELPIIVKKTDGSYIKCKDIKNAIITKLSGPAGFNETILKILKL